MRQQRPAGLKQSLIKSVVQSSAWFGGEITVGLDLDVTRFMLIFNPWYQDEGLLRGPAGTNSFASGVYRVGSCKCFPGGCQRYLD